MTKRSLIFIRHGQTDANATGLLLGRHDAPLNERGQQQAEAVAQALLNSNRFGQVRGVITSPLQRAHQTADAIVDAFQSARAELPGDVPTLSVDERFIELDYGVYDGQPLNTIDPDTWKQWQTDPTFTPTGGESLQTLHERVQAACTELMSQPQPLPEVLGSFEPSATEHESLIVVTHVSPLKAAVTWGLGVDDQVSWRTFVNNATITVITQNLGRLALVTFNEAAHLHDHDLLR